MLVGLRSFKMLLVPLVCAGLLTACLGQDSQDEDAGPSQAPPSTPGSSIVAPVTLTSSTSIRNNASQITVTGACLPSALIVVAGDAQKSSGCPGSGTFSISLPKTVDGTYRFSLTQGFSSAYMSTSVTVTWTRDTTPPAAPIITSPVNPPFYSNGNSIVLAGTCETGNTVNLTGAVTNTATCAANSFSFNISKSVDGLYVFYVTQRDGAGNVSQTVSATWVRDVVAPSAPAITSPVNPYTSADTDFSLAGSCEIGALVALSGSLTDSQSCATGTFAFPISESVDGTFGFSLRQTDRAGNNSTATAFSWSRTSVVPDTPVITFPASSVFYSSDSSLTITGTCTTGDTVNLAGSNTDSMICAASAFSFTVNQGSDATYTYSISQTLSGLTSGAVSVTWIRDTVAPAAPVITSPVTNPTISNANSLTLRGTCETGATVNMTGDASGTVSCSAGAFQFTASKSADGAYAFVLTQTDAAGNTSAGATFNWTRDTSLPGVVTVTSHTSPYLSNAGSVTIAGACESSATVSLTGDSTQTVACSANAYSFTVSKGSDAIYNFSVYQTDLAANQSPTVSFIWQRDATAPLAPTILNPGSSPYTSSGSNLIISGGCETGATVNISGASSASQSCAGGNYSFTVNKGSDGTYNYVVNQTDAAGNTSANSSQQWIRNSAVPATPAITSPAANPANTNGNSLTIAGTCVTGYTVLLSGGASASTTCASSAFSFTVTASADGSYVYQVIQQSLSSVNSAAATVTWNRDTAAPGTPVVSSPASSPLYTNGDSLTISGTCESLASVSLSGGATASTTCVSGTYSMTVNQSADGTYNFAIKQTDLAGNISGTVSVVWVRDTVAPSAPTIIQPNSNPYGSGDSTITIAGSCEPYATVSISGAASSTVLCSPLGAYSFNVSASVDDTYDYSLVQTDVTGNTSLAETFEWTRDTLIPATPSILAPSADPYYSNTGTITITATCEAGLTPASAVVTLFGDVTAGEVANPAGSLTQNCVTSPVSFTIQKSVDDTFTFSLQQENPNNGSTSASSSIAWVRDTSAPAAPTISNPVSSPFTSPGNLAISGSCEVNATVSLSGSDTQSMLCPLSGTYGFNVVKSLDATYTFSISQMDISGNNSAAANLTWVRNSASLLPPTITSPTANPYVSNSGSISISGACTTGYVVTLAGSVTSGEVSSPASSLTQVCAGSAYTYTINKAVDGTYTFSLIQSFGGANSAAISKTWTRDTSAPTPVFSSTPPATNLATSAAFVFTSDQSGSTFQCSLDGGSYATCSSPVTLSTLTNASHTYAIKAADAAGNVSAPVSYTWTQAAYKTLALYHLNSASPTVDSGLFGGAGYNNTLTATGSPALNTTGKYPTSSPASRTFGTGVYYSAASNAALNAGVSTMTIEGFVRITSSISSSGNYYTLVSKSGASPNLGFELRLQRSSSKYLLSFVGSQNGTTSTAVSSSTFSLSTNTWYYYAVTWNAGTVKFYLGSSSASSKGSKTIGTVGSAKLFATTAPLILGANATSGTGTSLYLQGALDEVRMSQIVRTVAYPTTEFTAD